jgi:CubicO group peptidase (beta-lactamase class C family)
MKKLLLFSALLVVLFACDKSDPKPADSMYFPPNGSTTWETTSPQSLGWNETKLNELDDFLETTNTRALIILKDGKIVVEKYFGKQLVNTSLDFTATSNWYWASAGKTLTSALVGIAESKGEIDFDASTSDYLGAGWSSLSTVQESKIKVRHQLTMTSGLDDDVVNPDCTEPSCLVYKAEPGARWAYHNAPYTLLDEVVAQATGSTLNDFLNAELESKIGMVGEYIQTGDNNVYYSTPRAMARFGLLLLNKGTWDQTEVIPESYFELMTTTSQNLNLSYGYLTWLNGKSSFMIPKLQTVFPGSVSPNAPDEMVAAMGKNGQLINVVPSEGLVVIRMGDDPETGLVPFTYQDDLWEKLNEIIP